MRVLLAHVAQIGNVVSHDHVGEGEVGGGAVGQVTHDQSVGLAAGLVHHEEVGDGVGSARLQQLLVLVVAAIQTLGVGDD